MDLFMSDLMRKKAKVLIVEDNPDHMQAATTILEYANYEVLQAENGHIGVDRAKKEKPDIILMDLEMPEMNGFEAIEELSFDDRTMDIPIIVLTAHNDSENRVRAEQLGCDGFLEKPFTPFLMETEFKRVLEASQPDR